MRRLSLAEIQHMQKDQLGFVRQLADEFGGVAQVKLLWFDMFFINEPALMRALLINHSHQMHRDPFVSNVFKRFMGNGVFIAEGDIWRQQRKLVQPAFHAMRIRQYTDVMASYTRQMVARWSSGKVLAIDNELTQLTLRIIAKTMYDVDVDEQTAVLGQLMKEVLTVAEAQLKSSFVPPVWLPTPLNRRQQKAKQAVRAFLLDIIRQRQADEEDRGDLLSMLLQVQDEAGQPMPEQQVLDECLTLFVAGHETTAAALTWTWYLLTQHPEVAQRLQGEITAVLADQPITFEHLARLPLLEAVIKETLRLYPPAFGFGRTVMEPFTIDNYTFPKGAIILFNTFITHKRPDLYEHPEQFWPERFMDKDTQPDRYSYLPFGAGPRVCLGNMFAMLEAQVILATMLQHIHLERATNTPVELDTLITLRPRDPLMMRVKQRQVSHKLSIASEPMKVS